MRVAAKMLVLGTMTGVLGAADARAPELSNGPSALTSVPGSSSGIAPRVAPREEHSLVNIEATTASAPADDESLPDLWLLGGVGVGLIAYQLRRKHRLLRPQPFQLRPDR
jgi:hypothetical protein